MVIQGCEWKSAFGFSLWCKTDPQAVPVIPSSMQTRDKSCQGLPSAPFPTLQTHQVMQASYPAVSDSLRGPYLHQANYCVKLKGEDQVTIKFGAKYWSRRKNKSGDQRSKESTKPRSMVRKPQRQELENPCSKISQGWNKVRSTSLTQRRQEPGIKTKQTGMKSRRDRSKTTAKWHCRLPRATGGAAWHICC